MRQGSVLATALLVLPLASSHPVPATSGAAASAAPGHEGTSHLAVAFLPRSWTGGDARALVPQRGHGTITGTITGTAEVREEPPRRAPRRYPVRGGGGPKKVQEIPPVVFVKGSLPGGATAQVGALSMMQRDTTFTPAILVVPVGTSVEFPNGDDFFHNVFSYSDTERFDLGRYPRGQSKTVTFDEPGVVKIYCEVHDSMRAVVIVNANGFYSVVEEDGSFAIEGVPAGRHTVVLWDVDQGETEVEVEVPDGGEVEVSLELG